MTIGQLEAAVVETRYGFDNTQPENDTARPRARLAAIEAGGDTGLLAVGDAGSVVG
jgi:hypothetical protein